MSRQTDPIADMLTRIRNAFRANHLRVDIPSSKIKVRITRVMKDEGFIKNFKVINDRKQKILRIYLKYGEGKQPAILHLRRVSKAGRRVYIKASDIKPIYNNIGIWILSTSKGIVTNKTAKGLNVGGEVLCEIL